MSAERSLAAQPGGERQSRRIAEQRDTEGSGGFVPREIPADRLTPVYGTGEPTSGLPAIIRSAAYRLPSTGALRWMLSLFADRIDSAANLLSELITPGQQWLVARHYLRQARTEPLGVAWLVAAITLSVWLIVRRWPHRPPSRAERLARVLRRFRG